MVYQERGVSEELVRQWEQLVEDHRQDNSVTFSWEDVLKSENIDELTQDSQKYSMEITNLNQFVWRTKGRLEVLINRTIQALLNNQANFNYCISLNKQKKLKCTPVAHDYFFLGKNKIFMLNQEGLKEMRIDTGEEKIHKITADFWRMPIYAFNNLKTSLKEHYIVYPQNGDSNLIIRCIDTSKELDIDKITKSQFMPIDNTIQTFIGACESNGIVVLHLHNTNECPKVLIYRRLNIDEPFVHMFTIHKDVLLGDLASVIVAGHNNIVWRRSDLSDINKGVSINSGRTCTIYQNSILINALLTSRDPKQLLIIALNIENPESTVCRMTIDHENVEKLTAIAFNCRGAMFSLSYDRSQAHQFDYCLVGYSKAKLQKMVDFGKDKYTIAQTAKMYNTRLQPKFVPRWSDELQRLLFWVEYLPGKTESSSEKTTIGVLEFKLNI